MFEHSSDNNPMLSRGSKYIHKASVSWNVLIVASNLNTKLPLVRTLYECALRSRGISQILCTTPTRRT